MSSRFDIAMGKITREHKKPVKNISAPRQVNRPEVTNFVSRLKIVNEQNQQEFKLTNADFSLSVASTPTGNPIASVSISFNCPVNDAQRIFSRS